MSLWYYATPEKPESFAKEIIRALDDDDFDINKIKDFSKNYTWESRSKSFMKFIS